MVDGCVALLRRGDETDASLIVALGGPPARLILSGESRADPEMWIRVWALRGLLWTWDERASAVVGDALSDDSWRVREMAAKVIRRHLVADHLDALAALQDDPTARVRTVAADALRRITAAQI